jgi:hypothetical protein
MAAHALEPFQTIAAIPCVREAVIAAKGPSTDTLAV